ncbi:MAG: recombinase family protein [Lachnospiraceae bacterium]|nr:recombinase family protein [Lachnospiraceae bacterium]
MGYYIDVGRTGTDFRREGFEQMLQDIRKRRIDCVIVKDLSRFGRNYIETGNYVQRVFPFMGVRFIALTDGIDTFEAEPGIDGMSFHLKNLVNEMYARDISEKVRSSKRSRQEQGSYTGGLPPYGYQAKWVDGKKCLFICPETSEIVRDIYRMFLSGKNMRQIARELFIQGIHRPGAYRKTGHAYQQEGEVLEQWGTGTIKFILENPVYTGRLVQGTKPIISEEIFYQAASKFGKQPGKCCNTANFLNKEPLEEDRYSGILFCGECGRPMARRVNIKKRNSGEKICYYGYYCQYSKRLDDLRCPVRSIGIKTLDGLVKAALCQEISLSDLRMENLEEEFKRLAAGQEKQIRQEIARYGKMLADKTKQGSGLYQKYHMGSFSLEVFQQWKKKNEEDAYELSKKIEQLESGIGDMETKRKKGWEFLQNLIKCGEDIRLTKEIAHALIQRVDIYPGFRVGITFAYGMGNRWNASIAQK